MKFYQKHKKMSIWITAFFFAAAVIIFKELFSSLPSIWSGFSTLISIMSPFVVGFAIAFILYIPSQKIENLFKKLKPGNFFYKHSRGFSVLLVYILGLTLIAVVLSIILPWLVRNIIGLYENRDAYYLKIDNFINSKCDENGKFYGMDPNTITGILRLEKLVSMINLEQLSSVANGVYQFGSAVIETILAVFSSIYMLLSRESLIRSVGRFLTLFTTKKRVFSIRQYLCKISSIFYSYIYSALLDALVVSIMCTIAFFIIGLDYAPLFGFAIGIANLIPYFGAIICGAGVAIFALITDGLLPAIIVAVSILAIQQIDSNVIQPKIVGKSVGIHPLYTLMAITLGGGLFGFWGILLGVPIAATVQLLMTEIIDMRELRLNNKKNSDTDDTTASEQ